MQITVNGNKYILWRDYASFFLLQLNEYLLLLAISMLVFVNILLNVLAVVCTTFLSND